MSTIPKPAADHATGLSSAPISTWPRERAGPRPAQHAPFNGSLANPESRPAGSEALQALLAFSAMHQQIRFRRALAMRNNGFDAFPQLQEFEPTEQYILDDVLQSVAQRAIAITGADGLGIALAENDEIVLRASAGAIKPDVGARIQRDSAFSGACFRLAQIIRCDDTEKDSRVNIDACRKLGARSMVAVPLCGRRRVIGLLEAFSAEPFGFNDSDVSSLELLAELVVSALKPEEEDNFAQSAQVAEAKLASPEVDIPAAQSQPTEYAVSEMALPIVVAVSAPVADPEIAPVASSFFELPTTPAGAEQDFDRQGVDIDETTLAEVAAEPAPERHPGAVLVLMLLVLCILVAAGVWWRLKSAAHGITLVPSVQNAAANPAAAKPPTPSDVPATTTDKHSAADHIANSSSPSNATTESKPPADSDSVRSSEASSETSKLSRITGIRHWSAADSSTVVIDLEEQVQYEAHRLSNPDRIYFDLHETALAPDIAGKTIEIGDALLTRVRLAQPVSGLTRVVLETKGNPTYSVSLEPNPYRLVVQVTKAGTNPKSQISLFPVTADAAKQRQAIVIPPPTHEDMQLRARVPKMRIVVDAGHGGWDLGTVGKRGLLEKDVVLEIAQRLGKLLQSRLGAEVILTRNDDNYIPLDERAGIANQAQADLFISVHANYSDLPSARGVETYYTNFFSSPSSSDLETRQNAAPNPTPVSARMSGLVSKTSQSGAAAELSAADLHERIEQSRRLAASVQRSLYGTLSAQNPGLRDRGVKEASYVVLTETAMPGILAEVSFVSSPADEQKLRSDGYREQIAEALYKGIAHYAAASHGVKMASAAK